jgi:hypothetical protein
MTTSHDTRRYVLEEILESPNGSRRHGRCRQLRESTGRSLMRELRERDESDAELERSAAGGGESEAYRVKMRLRRQHEDALEAGDWDAADEFHELLKQHHREQGAGAEVPSRDFGLRQGVGGGGGTASRECLHWLNRLRGGAKPLLESRRVDRWLKSLRS